VRSAQEAFFGRELSEEYCLTRDSDYTAQLIQFRDPVPRMRKFLIAAIAPFVLWETAHAQCTPEGMARFRESERQIQAAAARVRSGDCSALDDLKRAHAAQRAILQRSARQTYPYTCNVTFKTPPRVYCGGNAAAEAALLKKETDKKAGQAPPPVAAAQPVPSPGKGTSSASCSDITGTSSTAPAATHCNDANRALRGARLIRQSNPKVAAEEYNKAATAARSAGDHTFELSILREAVELAAPAMTAAVPPSAPTEIAAATPPPPSVSAVPRMWDGTREKCPDANNLERRTASYYVMCVEPTLPRKSNHRPNPDPVALGRQAREACGSYSRDTQNCFADFKLKAILQSNPGLRETCEKEAERQNPLRQALIARFGSRRDTTQRFRECVDNVYLYGHPHRSSDQPQRSLRETLRERMNAPTVEAGAPYPPADNTPRGDICGANGRCCQKGHGMKPTPGAFGAWSCQPLGLLSLRTTRSPLNVEEADEIEDFAERADALVANAVSVALEAHDLGISENDLPICTQAALAATNAMLRGGSPTIPAQCRGLTHAARAGVTRYADAHVDNSNAAMEELLASFRIDLGIPLPE
jgi:hypothetical protein